MPDFGIDIKNEKQKCCKYQTNKITFFLFDYAHTASEKLKVFCFFFSKKNIAQVKLRGVATLRLIATPVSSVKKEEKMEKFRSRKMCLLLYPLEDKTHKKALEFIKLNYDYACITHNQDKNEQGETKKSHVHVILRFTNAKWNTAIAEELGIAPNYIEKCRDLEKALEYLIHYNDDTKHQYDIEEVQGNLKGELKKKLANDGKDENIKAYELMDYIENYEGYIDEMQFFKYACELGMFDVARRSSYILLRLIDKHNHVLASVEFSEHKKNNF